MLLMAKRRKDRHQKTTTSFRLNDVVMDQLRKLTEQTRRTLSTEVAIALEEHLAKHGLWPPGEQRDQP